MNGLAGRQRTYASQPELSILTGGQAPRYWRQRLEHATAWLEDLQRASDWTGALTRIKLVLSDRSLWGETLAALTAEIGSMTPAADLGYGNVLRRPDAGGRVGLRRCEPAQPLARIHRQASALADSSAVGAGTPMQGPTSIRHAVAFQALPQAGGTGSHAAKLPRRADHALLRRLAGGEGTPGGSFHSKVGLVMLPGASSSPQSLQASRDIAWQGEHSEPGESASRAGKPGVHQKEDAARAWRHHVVERVRTRLYRTSSWVNPEHQGHGPLTGVSTHLSGAPLPVPWTVLTSRLGGPAAFPNEDETSLATDLERGAAWLSSQRTYSGLDESREFSADVKGSSIGSLAPGMEPLSQQWWTRIAALQGPMDAMAANRPDARPTSGPGENLLPDLLQQVLPVPAEIPTTRWRQARSQKPAELSVAEHDEVESLSSQFPTSGSQSEHGWSRPRVTKGTPPQSTTHVRAYSRSAHPPASATGEMLTSQALAEQWSIPLTGPMASRVLLGQLAQRSLPTALASPQRPAAAEIPGLSDTTPLAAAQNLLPGAAGPAIDALPGQRDGMGRLQSSAGKTREAGLSRHGAAEWTPVRSGLGLPSQVSDILELLRKASPEPPGQGTPAVSTMPFPPLEPSLEPSLAPGALHSPSAVQTAWQGAQYEAMSTEEDLGVLAVKIKRILDEEARRFGIDV